MDSSNENVTVTCTILGENFNLRCEKNQKLKLEQAIATLQEKVKNQIEGATKFKVQSINVQVVNVNVVQ